MNILPELRKFGNLKNPLFQFFLFLSLFALLSTYDYVSTAPIVAGVPHVLSTLMALVMSLAIVELTLRTTSLNPYNFLISTLIVILLVHPHEVFWQVPFVIVCIWAGKKYAKVNNHHVFNPAALGLAIASGCMLIGERVGLPVFIVSWWGADMGQWFLQDNQMLYNSVSVISFLGFLYFAKAFKKIPYVLTFLVLYPVILLVTKTGTLRDLFPTISQNIIFSTIAFMALVMFVEPKTSPVFLKQQVAIGVLGALLLYVLNTYGSVLPIDPFILTILGANVATFFLKTKRLLQ
jgi:hypothetical protein